MLFFLFTYDLLYDDGAYGDEQKMGFTTFFEIPPRPTTCAHRNHASESSSQCSTVHVCQLQLFRYRQPTCTIRCPHSHFLQHNHVAHLAIFHFSKPRKSTSHPAEPTHHDQKKELSQTLPLYAFIPSLRPTLNISTLLRIATEMRWRHHLYRQDTCEFQVS